MASDAESEATDNEYEPAESQSGQTDTKSEPTEETKRALMFKGGYVALVLLAYCPISIGVGATVKDLFSNDAFNSCLEEFAADIRAQPPIGLMIGVLIIGSLLGAIFILLGFSVVFYAKVESKKNTRLFMVVLMWGYYLLALFVSGVFIYVYLYLYDVAYWTDMDECDDAVDAFNNARSWSIAGLVSGCIMIGMTICAIWYCINKGIKSGSDDDDNGDDDHDKPDFGRMGTPPGYYGRGEEDDMY